MVVALDLERARPAVAHVDDARILARPLDNASGTFGPRAARRQPLQVYAAGFVRAMLRPHHAEDAQLGQARRPPHQLFNTRILIRRNAMRLQQRRSDRRWRGYARRSVRRGVCRSVGCIGSLRRSCEVRLSSGGHSSLTTIVACPKTLRIHTGCPGAPHLASEMWVHAFTRTAHLLPAAPATCDPTSPHPLLPRRSSPENSSPRRQEIHCPAPRRSAK